MTWRELPAPSVFERLAARGAEREFAMRVERAFPVEPAALARVRAAVVGSAAVAAPQPLRSPRFQPTISWERSAPFAMALAVVLVAGVVMTGARTGGSPLAARPALERPVQMAAILDRSATRLKNALATIQTSDATTVATILVAFRDDLASVEAALQRPGTDLAAAASSLRAQAGDLATMAVSMPAEDVSLYVEVTGRLDRIIAALPDPAGGSTHPGAGGPPAGTGVPSPTAHPGNGGNGNPGGNGNSAGNGNPNPGGNGNSSGNPNPGTGNPKPGGNGKPHPSPRGNGKPNATPPGAGNGNDKGHGILQRDGK